MEKPITPTIEDKPTVEDTVIKSEPVEAKTSETNSIETQIQELKHLKDLGVLTEEQYKDAITKIISNASK